MGYYQFFIIFICYIFFILFNTLDADATVIYEGPAVVHESEQFFLTCRTNRFATFKWRQNDSTIDFESSDSYSQKQFSNNSEQSTILSVKFALPKHEGNYKCSYEIDDYGHNLTVVVGNTIKLKLDSTGGPGFPCRPESLSPDPSKCVIGVIYKPLTLSCNPDVLLNDTLTIAWYKSERNSRETDKSSYVESTKRIKVNGNQLHFIEVSLEDIGIYRCKIVNKGQEKQDLTPVAQNYVELQVLPYIVSLYKDSTVIEENTINVTCTVVGNVTRVYWKFEKTPLFNGTGGRVELRDFNGIKDATLLIYRANHTTDRGHYNCTAESLFGNSSQDGQCFVRVKSKYAALGPFFGICAEVIILCTIILIYEKKRDKTELEESDTDQGPETKSSPDHGQDSVRYRK